MKILKKMILEGLGSSANPDDVPNFLMSSEEANDIRASSTPEKGTQVLKVHSDKRKNEE